METPPGRRRLSVAPFATQAARGLIREQSARRWLMLILVVGAAAMLFAGTTFLRGTLDHHEHPGWFILYWLACAWLTFTALLLALFDALTVRARARAARERLRAQFTAPGTPDSPRDTSRR